MSSNIYQSQSDENWLVEDSGGLDQLYFLRYFKAKCCWSLLDLTKLKTLLFKLLILQNISHNRRAKRKWEVFWRIFTQDVYSPTSLPLALNNRAGMNDGSRNCRNFDMFELCKETLWLEEVVRKNNDASIKWYFGFNWWKAKGKPSLYNWRTCSNFE